jgi:hypothetical protein
VLLTSLREEESMATLLYTYSKHRMSWMFNSKWRLCSWFQSDWQAGIRCSCVSEREVQYDCGLRPLSSAWWKWVERSSELLWLDYLCMPTICWRPFESRVLLIQITLAKLLMLLSQSWQWSATY